MHIRVIDLETTGFTAPEHGVCEIGWNDLHHVPGTGWVIGSGGTMLTDPCRTIPPEASAIHHIILEDVLERPSFDLVAGRVFRREPTPPIAYAAHNAKFERQWCTDEITGGVPWICTYKAALRLWPEAPGHSNQTLRYWRNPRGLDRKLASETHRAFPDAYVTAHLLRDMLEMAPVDDLIRWSSEPALQVRCHIGKWRGALWSDVDIGFLHWVAVRDFDEDVLFTVRHEIERRENLTAGEAE